MCRCVDSLGFEDSRIRVSRSHHPPQPSCQHRQPIRPWRRNISYRCHSIKIVRRVIGHLPFLPSKLSLAGLLIVAVHRSDRIASTGLRPIVISRSGIVSRLQHSSALFWLECSVRQPLAYFASALPQLHITSFVSECRPHRMSWHTGHISICFAFIILCGRQQNAT